MLPTEIGYIKATFKPGWPNNLVNKRCKIGSSWVKFQSSRPAWPIITSVHRPAIPHAFRERIHVQLPSPMRDTRLRLLPYFQNIFALIAPALYTLSLSKDCPHLNFHCPICQSHAIALHQGSQVCQYSDTKPENAMTTFIEISYNGSFV